MKFTIHIFGCQMNYADGARIRAILEYIGWTYVPIIEEAAVVIIVTCSVRGKAEDKVTGFIQDISSDKHIWITGCMPQHTLKSGKLKVAQRNRVLHSRESGKGRKEKIPDMFKVGNFLSTEPGVPVVLGKENNDWEKEIGNREQRPLPINYAFSPLFHRLSSTYSNLKLIFRIDDVGYLPLILSQIDYTIADKYMGDNLVDEYSQIIPRPTSMIDESKVESKKSKVEEDVGPFKNYKSKNSKILSAYVPISTGCSQFCSYCIVPYARGLEKHYPIQQILREVQTYLDQGVQEITLLGQIVNKHPQFTDLVRQILALPGGLKWLRYTSPYPTYFPDELLALHASDPRLCPHIHIPVQSGSDKILKLMRRGYTVDQFRATIDRIRVLPRPINLTSDIIVGFSEETEEDFQATLDLVNYCQFTMLFMGKYSVRPGTRGAKNLTDTVSKTIKEYRRHRLNDLFKSIAKKQNQTDVGSIQEIMVTHVNDHEVKGYTAHMKQVSMKVTSGKSKDIGGVPNPLVPNSQSLSLGQFATVRITSADELILHGECVG